MEKKDCIGHIQKRMGTALRELVSRHRGQKLADIGGAGRLTNTLMNSLQNYYGDAIRKSAGDLDGMVKAVQATLLHCNSSNAVPRHHLCPVGEDSWCRYQVAQARGEAYEHTNEPIPEAIVLLLKPIYACLGSRGLLAKCVDGYTQNANESLHNLVWRLCPKVLHLGKKAVEVACALAVCQWNDGHSSYQAIAKRLGAANTPSSAGHLQQRDIARMKKARYRVTDRAKTLRRRARRMRKGLDESQKRSEGDMYLAGAFYSNAPGPSSAAGRSGRTKNGGVGKGKGKAGGGGIVKGKVMEARKRPCDSPPEPRKRLRRGQ